MFDDWRERRRLRREIAVIARRYRSRLRVASDEDRDAIEEERDSEIAMPQLLLDVIELGKLTSKARALGLDDDTKSYSHGTGDGNAKLRKLSRDERLNVAERWVKILVPILTALVSLLGLLVALMTVLRQSPSRRPTANGQHNMYYQTQAGQAISLPSCKKASFG